MNERLLELEQTATDIEARINRLVSRGTEIAYPMRVARTSAGGGTYPTSGNTVYLDMLDGSYVRSPGDRTPLWSSRKGTPTIVGHNIRGSLPPVDTYVLAFHWGGYWWFEWQEAEGEMFQELTPATPGSGGSIPWDANQGKKAKVTLTGGTPQAYTLDNVANVVEGDELSLTVIQDSNGGHTLGFGTDYEFPYGLALFPLRATGDSTADRTEILDMRIVDNGSGNQILTWRAAHGANVLVDNSEFLMLTDDDVQGLMRQIDASIYLLEQREPISDVGIWDYDGTGTGGAVGGGKFTTSAGTYAANTAIRVDEENEDGRNQRIFLEDMIAGDKIGIVDETNGANYGLYVLTEAPTTPGNDILFENLTLETSGGTTISGKHAIIVIYSGFNLPADL